MSDYSSEDFKNLDTFIGKMKRAAIDSYMYFNYPDFYLVSEESNRYMRKANDLMEGNIEEYITRPDLNGKKGGIWSSNKSNSTLLDYDDVDFEAKFNSVRSRIDKLLKPWLDIPDPETIDHEVDECRKITSGLSGTATIEKGIVVGGGDIAAQLLGLHANLEYMSGDAITQFKKKFLLKLGITTSGLCAISGVLGGALCSERELFREARRAVVAAVEETRKAFERTMHGGIDKPFEIILQIATVIKEGVSLYLGTKPAVDLTFFALEATSKAGESDSTTENFEATNYEEVMVSFEKILKDINDEIRDGEKVLEKNLKKNTNIIRSNPSSFDLTIEKISSKAGVVILNFDLIEEITSAYMPTIAEDLAAIAKEAIALSMWNVVQRDESIGIGRIGPSDAFGKIMWLLYELLKDLSWDVENGGANLKAAVELIKNEDISTQNAMNAILTKIDQGSGTNPWD